MSEPEATVEVTLASALEEAVSLATAIEAAREQLSDIECALAELQEALGSNTVAAIIASVELFGASLDAIDARAQDLAASVDALASAEADESEAP